MQSCQPFYIGQCLVLMEEAAIQFEQQEKQAIQPKFLQVLAYLAQEYPRVIPREELVQHVWQQNVYAGEKALTNAIWHLRQKLAPIAPEHEVIETIRKKGYRLLIKPTWPTQETTKPNVLPDQPKKLYSVWLTLSFLIGLTVPFVIGLIIWLAIIPSASEKNNAINQITNEPGTELFPAPSPNGRWVAYQWTPNNGYSNLFLKDTSQPSLAARQLTFDEAIEGHSVWNNEGDALYFARKDNKAKTCEIVSLHVELNQETTIASCPIKGGYYYIDISPDGNTLAFHGSDKQSDNSGIYLLDLMTKKSPPERLSCAKDCGYKERDFAFSPDGKSIAVTRRVNRFNENIFLVNLNTKEESQLTFKKEDIVGLTWLSPTQLIYATQHADLRNGFIVNTQSFETTSIDIEGFSYPSVAKENKSIFFHQRKENYTIATYSLDEEFPVMPETLLQSDYNHVHPDYSAVQNKIAYTSNTSGHYELWVANKDGSKPEQLTQLKSEVRYPRWSHQGNKIAFLAPSSNQKTEQIFIIDILTKRVRQLTTKRTKFNRPTWSVDDKFIISAIYQKDFTDLYKINIEDGKYQRLTDDSARYGVMISESKMLYTKLTKGLWLKDISGDAKSEPEVLIPAKHFNSLYSWNYINGNIYFNYALKNHYQLNYFDWKTDKIKPILKLPKRNFAINSSISFIQNENKLLLNLSPYPQADIKQILKLNHEKSL